MDHRLVLVFAFSMQFLTIYQTSGLPVKTLVKITLPVTLGKIII